MRTSVLAGAIGSGVEHRDRARRGAFGLASARLVGKVPVLPPFAFLYDLPEQVFG